MYNMDGIFLFEKNTLNKTLSIYNLKSNLFDKILMEDFPLKDYSYFVNFIKI